MSQLQFCIPRKPPVDYRGAGERGGAQGFHDYFLFRVLEFFSPSLQNYGGGVLVYSHQCLGYFPFSHLRINKAPLISCPVEEYSITSIEVTSLLFSVNIGLTFYIAH